jgi:hypothetical protein
MTKFSWMIKVKWVARTREEIEALIEALKIMKPLLHRELGGSDEHRDMVG